MLKASRTFATLVRNPQVKQFSLKPDDLRALVSNGLFRDQDAVHFFQSLKNKPFWPEISSNGELSISSLHNYVFNDLYQQSRHTGYDPKGQEFMENLEKFLKNYKPKGCYYCEIVEGIRNYLNKETRGR